jgi:hypothetical protein
LHEGQAWRSPKAGRRLIADERWPSETFTGRLVEADSKISINRKRLLRCAHSEGVLLKDYDSLCEARAVIKRDLNLYRLKRKHYNPDQRCPISINIGISIGFR